MARTNRKWEYTDEHLAIAAENGISKRVFRQRLYQGMSVEDAMTRPIGKQGPKQIADRVEVVTVPKSTPWYLYQYYGMFGKW